MNRSTIQLFIAAALVAAPTSVMAQGQQNARCSVDSLDPAQAVLRIEWARKCGLLLNTAGPGIIIESEYFAAGGGQAQDYQENTVSRAYTGNTNDHLVNLEFAWGLYPGAAVYTTFQEASGPTAGYWKWSRPVQRPRPLYATFDSSPAGNGTMLVPTDLASCSLHAKNPTTGAITAAAWTGDFYVSFYCESSCYAPDQSLRFSDGDVNVVAAMKARRTDLVTLTADATLDDLATQTAKVENYTTEIRDVENVIYKLTMASGGSLSVTNEHPIITSAGRLVQAQKLAVGDELLKADGSPDAIIDIEKTTHFGKVYNLRPVSQAPVANLLIAQGYLVGSSRFQNDDIGYVNRILLFRGVPDDVIPK